MEAKMAKTEVDPNDHVQPTQAEIPNAKTARAAIFANTKPKVSSVTFRGFELELRQPSVTEFLSAQSNPDGEDRDATKSTLRLIVQFAYLAGTNERIFEPTDIDTLASMPMNGEFFNLIQRMNDLMDIKVEENVKN